MLENCINTTIFTIIPTPTNKFPTKMVHIPHALHIAFVVELPAVPPIHCFFANQVVSADFGPAHASVVGPILAVVGSLEASAVVGNEVVSYGQAVSGVGLGTLLQDDR